MIAILGDISISGEPPIHLRNRISSCGLLCAHCTSYVQWKYIYYNGTYYDSTPTAKQRSCATMYRVEYVHTYSYNIVIIIISVNADAMIRRLSKIIATKPYRTGICPLWAIITKLRERHRSITTPFSPLSLSKDSVVYSQPSYIITEVKWSSLARHLLPSSFIIPT